MNLSFRNKSRHHQILNDNLSSFSGAGGGNPATYSQIYLKIQNLTNDLVKSDLKLYVRYKPTIDWLLEEVEIRCVWPNFGLVHPFKIYNKDKGNFIFLINCSLLGILFITVGVKVRFRHPVDCPHSRLESYRRGLHVAPYTEVRGHRSRDVDRVTSWSSSCGASQPWSTDKRQSELFRETLSDAIRISIKIESLS